MEKIKGNITKHLIADFGTFQLYREDFERAIEQACRELQIDDLKSEGQRPWKAVCKRVGEIIFNDNSILKDKQLYDNPYIPTNYNRYNYNILNCICDEYIYFSDIYNKLCSTVAFSSWCNIDCGVIDNWRLNNESSPISYEIWKKLQGIRKDCIKDRAYDNKSPVGAMFVGNNEFGMNQPGIGYEATQARALTANELPQLDGVNSQNIKALSSDNMVDNAK